ncbi:dynein heavy chain, point mutation [Leishmania mexicana MHOM/GT/2001/U1103]|uniref:dynein heavy chain, point mutation n=1 Tax=Leishmania mexicana (strain MHOM/GT/2001/U1103) TaxID=929439 RepID=UPI0001F809EC|nr:dynein heavy chain, point mutation [Leishmania mexicana MHOM/GT/2001/U1103]CBZ28360.1 dynein heavy chain, point mutation [Leishmania mexicana MHOM/GT/2001/U1103]
MSVSPHPPGGNGRAAVLSPLPSTTAAAAAANDVSAVSVQSDAHHCFVTSQRLRDIEAPLMEHLALKRYAHSSAGVGATMAKSQRAPRHTAVPAPSSGMQQRGADPAAPLRKVRVPCAIQRLLDMHTSLALSSGVSPLATQQHKILPHPPAATILSATPDCAVHERVGLLYHPLAAARTAYAETEVRPSSIGAGAATVADATAVAPFAMAATAAENKTYFALADFDAADEDPRTPAEWLAMGSNDEGGTPATSRFFKTTGPGGGTVVWRTCRVREYDEARQLFYVQWTDGTGRWTRRLNIRFDAEDVGRWEARVRRADDYRSDTEAAMREALYIDSIPNACVTAMEEAQMEQVLRNVATRFPVAQLHTIQQRTEEAEATYYRAMKLAVHTYMMRGAAEQERLQIANLPRAGAPAQPSLRDLRGTLDTPSPNFLAARAYLAENCFQVHALIQDTLHSLHTLWFSYTPKLLSVSHYPGSALPLRLPFFVSTQEEHGVAVGERLKGEWTSTVQSTVQNNLDAYFNFYDDNMARYEASRMCRFVRLVNCMMRSQLRELTMASLESYTAYLEKYVVVCANAADSDDAAAAIVKVLPEDVAERAYWAERIAQLEARQAAEKERRAAEQKVAPKKRRSNTAAAAAPNGEAEEASSEHLLWCLGTPPVTESLTQRVVQLIQRINGLRPLFYTKLVVASPLSSKPPLQRSSQVAGDDEGDAAECAIVLDPPVDEIERCVLRVVARCLEHSNEVAAMGDQLFPLLEMAPAYLRPLGADETEVVAVRERVLAVLRGNRDAPLQLVQMYREFEYLATANVEEVIQATLEHVEALEEVDLLLERLSRDRRRLGERTPNTVTFELYAVDCCELKAALTARAVQLQQALLEAVATRLAEECAGVLSAYEAINAELTVEPTTPEELQTMRAALAAVAAREAAIQVIFQHVTEGNELLLRYGYLVPHDEFVHYWEAYEWPKRLAQFVEDRNFRAKEYRAVFIQQLRENSEQQAYAIMQLAASVEDFTHLCDDARAEEYYERARAIEESIQSSKASAALYGRHEELFGMTVTTYPQLTEIQQLFEPYFALWEVVYHFNAETERWMSTKIATLNPRDVDQKVSDWAKRVAALSRKIKEPEAIEVARQLRANIEQFKPLVPLLYALRSHLQAGHWRAIYQQCGIPRDQQGFGPGGVDNNDQRTLSDFVQLGMMDHLTSIESVASVAQKTYELESELMNMVTEWKRLVFEMEPYQDTFKLKANDAMQLTLDEHILKTQSMLGKPTVRQTPALQARVTQWSDQLNNTQSTMDEWFRCQSTWSYLEPIFVSADISRSLPAEKKMFVEIDDTWHAVMARTRATPQIITRCQDDSLYKTLSSANTNLEEILRKLQQFLETKRMAFPRFYFISNEELLQILSDSRDPYLVQPYLCKCFEGIKTLTFADHHDMVGMESAEGERVRFVRTVNPSDHHNQVELWLQAVENAMKATIRDQLQQAIGDYTQRKRTEFIRAWPGQVVIAVCCFFWTMEATQAMVADGTVGLTTYYEKCARQLDDLILLVRDSGLGNVARCTLEALVVIEVHAKDILRMLGEKGVESPSSFDWLAQLRYYWEGEEDNQQLTVQQINASLRYGYEYLGNTGRLVITPLTDRCYRTLIGALHLNYGGAPEGPAGTGKTETTKDLAKALGKYCVVYNCSDQISAKDMAKLFRGLTQAGAWGCFDEFNRIEIQVLSVIAQQIATIQEAIIQKRPEFIFEGAQIRLDSGCAVFVTMNPGYAGRAELPDNLKALFRPVAMMVPNYAMIGEIQLYSYGFLHGKVLSEKIVATYRLCSEQLSSQDHYDYGMRAVKAVLTAAGRLKRAYPMEDEMVLMLRSIQDVNLPKFLSQDVGLFRGIVSDLFPGVQLPVPDYDDMHNALVAVAAQDNLQLTTYFEEKICQTYEMICVRHGMMLVGYSYGGKTKGLQSLAAALEVMEQTNKSEHRARMAIINPKSVTMAQLYGKVELSGEWTDGILSSRFRQLAQDTSEDRVWLVLDGPVDAVWIENMNTVLDDNKKLCLQNGDIIPMPKRMNLIFEVQDLAHASPATVSRCGMVYVEPHSLGWACLLESFFNTLPPFMTETPQLADTLRFLIDVIMADMLEVTRKRARSIVPQSANTLVASCAKLLSSFMHGFDEDAAIAQTGGDERVHMRNMVMRVEGWFLFSLVWSVGGCLEHKDREIFSAALHKLLAALPERHGSRHSFTLALPEATTSFYEVRFEDGAEVRLVSWIDLMPELTIQAESEYQDIIVPTTETVKYSFLMELMVRHMHPALLVGDTGTGKTILMKALLRGLPKDGYSVNLIQFSAQTSAGHLQRLIDSNCEKRRKGFYGPPINKKMIIFIDDTNLPQLEEYGAQPPIELLRQYLDHGGWYQHSKDGVEFRHLVDALLLCAMGPAGGGRNDITQRFSRHFNVFSVPSFNEATLKTLFGRLSEWIFSRNFPSALRGMSAPLVAATVELYTILVDNLKPSPERSHYTFNLRDVSKVFQGMDMTYAPGIKDEMCLAQLWMHEVSRAFADRFIDDADTHWFHEQASRTCLKHLKLDIRPTMEDGSPLLFSSLANDDGRYEQLTDIAHARSTLERKQEFYKTATRSGELNLVIFNYVLEHVARISRVLHQPGGHVLLIGVGGSGRRSCARLGAFIQECDYRTTTPAKDYDHSDFLDDIRQLLLQTGQKGYSTAFVLADSQIISETFLEDICSLLNTGEIPGLWDTKQDREVYDNAVASLRDVGRALGRPDTTEALQELFVERCRKHLHVVLCFSPLGSMLRERLRKFPSLVNCTTIDWFQDWPEDGLHSVAARFLDDVDLSEEERTSIRQIFVQYQQQVRELSVKYRAEARQQTYVTPTSYLDLLSTFGRMLTCRRQDLTSQRDRYVNGLRQLKKTEDQVEVMQQELALLKPELATKQAETSELIRRVEEESKAAEEQKAIVAVDEAAANAQATAAKKIKDASQEKVDEAQPLVEQAQRAVLDLDPKVLQEVKALKTPPKGVKYVIEVLCTLLGGVYKPKPIRDALTGKTSVPYWEHAKVTLLTADFKNTLLNAYSDIVDNAPNAQIEEVKKKMTDEMFKMENIRKTSVALVGVATYIKAVVEYYKQNKVIKPLLAQAAAAQAEYDEAMIGLHAKKEELRIITEKLQALTDRLDGVNRAKQELENRVRDTDTKLTRAKKLIEGLGGEKARFAHESKRYEEELLYVVGNVVVSAGIVAYMGPFLHNYRMQIIGKWRDMCEAQQLRVSADYTFEKFCGNSIHIQEWKLQQLPSDPFSVDNAVILSNSNRWPLMVDPQQQANRWIRSRERDSGLVVVRLFEKDYLRTIRQAIMDGHPVLLENVEETLDPMLENLLLKRITKEGSMWVMHLGEAVEWNEKFRFYITTKLPRPHYLPEVSAKVTLINFRITEQGLQDQLLQRVMLSERREVEEKKQALTLEAAANQAGLKATEDRILAILSTEGNILESEAAIEELDSSKEQSDRIEKRQEEIDAMERISDRTRNLFVPVAHLGAILFFCVTELANIDPMYQHSLQSYMVIFQEALASSARSSKVEERTDAINTTFKRSLYQRICRALFARDQLLFSFIMSLKMFAVDAVLLRWLLTGGTEEDERAAAVENPFTWMAEPSWRLLQRASTQLSGFENLIEDVRQNEMFFMDYYESSSPLELKLPGELQSMPSIAKMVLVRCLRMDKVVPAIRAYVFETLGEFFVEPPLYALETVVEELAYDPSVPIILVLSPGADPNAELDRVAELRGMFPNKLFKLSLGQGQNVPACALIEAGTKSGHWVLLQNCHLYADFMPQLSRMIEDYSDVAAKERLHRDYRLWLTSLPSEVFPVAILQNGVKLVQEPPKGLKSNLMQSYLSDPVADAEFFGAARMPEVWHKLLFGLCFFHAVVQERRQYGPLGWSRPYEFNDTDRRISVRQLQMLLNENELVPYEALLYLIGECNYGGRVTDDWDRRCLLATLEVYLTPSILEDNYVFCDDAQEYFAPPFGEYSTYLAYIQSLPAQQPPTVFGLHENADITKDERDARFLLDATLSTQPRDAAPAAGSSSGGGNEADPKTMVKTLAADVLHRLPPLFDIEAIQARYPIDYAQSMNTVLLQEAIRYNRLLAVVRASLADVQDAISGKVVMSSELEQVFISMYDGKVPEVWKRRSYPSLKPFGAYVSDLIARLQFLRTWYEAGPPPLFWLSGFFFTQSFLTGVTQNYARKHKIEIDKLVWEFTVMPASAETFTETPEDGCYVHGLFLEGADWSYDGGVLAESKPKELYVAFPVLKLSPALPEEVVQCPIYHCPCYKTTDRRGVLSTTGHSTNFILTVNLPRDTHESESHWVLRGTALFTQLEY